MPEVRSREDAVSYKIFLTLLEKTISTLLNMKCWVISLNDPVQSMIFSICNAPLLIDSAHKQLEICQ